jgi:hypothetical protein
VAGLALAVPAIGWLVVNQLARNPTAVVAVIAAGGVLLFFTARSGWDRGWKHATLAATAVGLAVAVVQLVQPPDTNLPTLHRRLGHARSWLLRGRSRRSPTWRRLGWPSPRSAWS